MISKLNLLRHCSKNVSQLRRFQSTKISDNQLLKSLIEDRPVKEIVQEDLEQLLPKNSELESLTLASLAELDLPEETLTEVEQDLVEVEQEYGLLHSESLENLELASDLADQQQLETQNFDPISAHSEIMLRQMQPDHILFYENKRKFHELMVSKFGRKYKKAPKGAKKDILALSNLSDPDFLTAYNSQNVEDSVYYNLYEDPLDVRYTDNIKPSKEIQRKQKHNSGHLRIMKYDSDNQLVGYSYSTVNYPRELYKKSLYLVNFDYQKLTPNQLKVIGKKLPYFIKNSKTNLNNRADIPWEWFEYLPRRAKFVYQQKFIDMHKKAWIKRNRDSPDMLAAEMALSKEDLGIYKGHVAMAGQNLYDHVKQSIKHRLVFDHDIGPEMTKMLGNFFELFFVEFLVLINCKNFRFLGS